MKDERCSPSNTFGVFVGRANSWLMVAGKEVSLLYHKALLSRVAARTTKNPFDWDAYHVNLIGFYMEIISLAQESAPGASN